MRKPFIYKLLFRFPVSRDSISSLSVIIIMLFFFWSYVSDPVYATATVSPQTLSLELDTDTELNILRFNSQGKYLLIWLPSSAVSNEDVATISQNFQRSGIEIWHADFFDAYFLARTASSDYKIPARDIKRLLDFAIETVPDKKIYFLGSSRTVITIFEGLRLWQLGKQQTEQAALKQADRKNEAKQPRFGGVILNSPYFFVETPDPGKDAELMPIVSHTNLPIYILQPELSPRFWQLKTVLPVLEQAGSDVYIHYLKNVRARFHFRPDATIQERQLTQNLPAIVLQGMNLLNTVNNKNRHTSSKALKQVKITEGKKDRTLQPYIGNPNPPDLRLVNLKGEIFDLSNRKNRVVLVNFWTTWCPPCIHEMPSLQRLSKILKNEPFDLVGVNLAEEKTHVEAFIQSKVRVNFPILLDDKGKTIPDWKINAFPTTYIIDKHGKIRYGLFGSMDWDTPEVLNILHELLSEAS